MDDARLIALARQSANQAYAPYSRFLVGAALLTTDGKVFCGCNVENASYGLTICAERVAICSAVAAGHKNFHAITIVANPPATPCGACRQFLAEFAGPSFRIIVAPLSGSDHAHTYTMAELLPHHFVLETTSTRKTT